SGSGSRPRSRLPGPSTACGPPARECCASEPTPQSARTTTASRTTQRRLISGSPGGRAETSEGPGVTDSQPHAARPGDSLPGASSTRSAQSPECLLSLTQIHALREHHVAAVSLYPGLVRTESVLKHSQFFGLSNTESPQF